MSAAALPPGALALPPGAVTPQDVGFSVSFPRATGVGYTSEQRVGVFPTRGEAEVRRLVRPPQAPSSRARGVGGAGGGGATPMWRGGGRPRRRLHRSPRPSPTHSQRVLDLLRIKHALFLGTPLRDVPLAFPLQVGAWALCPAPHASPLSLHDTTHTRTCPHTHARKPTHMRLQEYTPRLRDYLRERTLEALWRDLFTDGPAAVMEAGERPAPAADARGEGGQQQRRRRRHEGAEGEEEDEPLSSEGDEEGGGRGGGCGRCRGSAREGDVTR